MTWKTASQFSRQLFQVDNRKPVKLRSNFAKVMLHNFHKVYFAKLVFGIFVKNFT